jgi:uncharacterized protein (TIGR03083 family)
MAQATVVGDNAQLWRLIHEQRLKVAEMLDTLEAPEWEAQSLCAGWRIRDVAAHCIETHRMTPPKFIGRFAGSGFRFNAFNAKGVAKHTIQSPAELVADYRESAPGTTSPPGPKATWLAEVVIHGEDIARPLGRQVDVSPSALATVAAFCVQSTPLLHGKQRSAGLRLRATDIEWTSGDGPEVSGPAAALILAITGRKSATEDLAGDGLSTLRSRIV